MELPEIIDQETEPPQYQRFIALNIQVPHVEGQHIYDRVTVTSSLRDLAEDLSLVLPSAVKRSLQIEFPDHRMAVRRSRRELPSPNPKHDPYVAVCSCGQADCEHLDYAIRHLEHIQRLSENSGRIAHLIREVSQRALIAEQERAESEDSLAKLNRERDRLSTELEALEREGRQVTRLRDKLTQEEGKILRLRTELEEKNDAVELLHSERETYQQNLTAMRRAFYDTRSETAAINSDQIPAETLDILQQYFIPPSSLLSPAEKFQDNVYSDHHRVGNTQGIIKQLAGIAFVREIGISFRHPAKSGKVRVMPEVDVLELVVPHKGEADIIRVLTCTLTKSQQIFGAYLLARRFNVEVQYE